MTAIAFERIPQKKIRSFLKQQENGLITLKPSFSNWENLNGLYEHEETFNCSFKVEDVWKFYMESNPKDVWKGNLVSFGLIFCRNSKLVFYRDDVFKKAATGQVYFINLRLLGGIYNLAVSHEIVNIDESQKFIEISYIEGGKSIGIQRISLHVSENNTTRIVHKSYYKSKSYLRDKFLYPYFHTKVLKEYHNSMIRHIKNTLSASI